jgi:16S rRNA processing protein RimM
LKVCLKTPDNEIGNVVGFENFGAGEIIEIKLKGQKETELLPFTKQYVPTINLESGYIIVSSATMIFAEDDDEDIK